MKFTKIASMLLPRERTLAIFVMARIIKHRDGRIECRGGSLADRRQMVEWCSLFMHDAAVDVVPRTAARDYFRLGGENRNLPTAKVPTGPSLWAQASQWCSHFLHNAAIDVAPKAPAARSFSFQLSSFGGRPCGSHFQHFQKNRLQVA